MDPACQTTGHIPSRPAKQTVTQDAVPDDGVIGERADLIDVEPNPHQHPRLGLARRRCVRRPPVQDHIIVHELHVAGQKWKLKTVFPRQLIEQIQQRRLFG